MIRSITIGSIMAALVTTGLAFFLPIYSQMHPSDVVVWDFEARTYATWRCIREDTVEVRYVHNIFDVIDPPAGLPTLRSTAMVVDLDEARRFARKLGGGPDHVCQAASGYTTSTTLAAIVAAWVSQRIETSPVLVSFIWRLVKGALIAVFLTAIGWGLNRFVTWLIRMIGGRID